MAQNCTILCPADEPQRVLALVRDLIGIRGQVTVKGQTADWASITVRGSGATLTLNRRIFRKAGDAFSRMQTGMWTYFDGVETDQEVVKAEVLRRVEEFELAIGVVAEPEFVESAGHFDCVFGIASALDSIVWNGSGVLDAKGRLLLTAEGESEQ